MKILLIGGAGLIGSRLVPLLLEDGHEVLVLDNFTSNCLEHSELPVEVISGNACSFSNVNRAFSYFKPDCVSVILSLNNKNIKIWYNLLKILLIKGYFTFDSGCLLLPIMISAL